MKKVKTTIMMLVLMFSPLLFYCSDNDENREPEIVDENGLNGVWKGTGTSSLFPSPYAVTFDLIDNEGTLTGKFYINSTTNAGFGGSDDGNFYAKIEGDSLVDVKVTQILANLDCPGVFEGSGKVQSNGTIKIDWSGTDCSGLHENGIFNLTKQ